MIPSRGLRVSAVKVVYCSCRQLLASSTYFKGVVCTNLLLFEPSLLPCWAEPRPWPPRPRAAEPLLCREKGVGPADGRFPLLSAREEGWDIYLVFPRLKRAFVSHSTNGWVGALGNGCDSCDKCQPRTLGMKVSLGRAVLTKGPAGADHMATYKRTCRHSQESGTHLGWTSWEKGRTQEVQRTAMHRPAVLLRIQGTASSSASDADGDSEDGLRLSSCSAGESAACKRLTVQDQAAHKGREKVVPGCSDRPGLCEQPQATPASRWSSLTQLKQTSVI